MGSGQGKEEGGEGGDKESLGVAELEISSSQGDPEHPWPLANAAPLTEIDPREIPPLTEVESGTEIEESFAALRVDAPRPPERARFGSEDDALHGRGGKRGLLPGGAPGPVARLRADNAEFLPTGAELAGPPSRPQENRHMAFQAAFQVGRETPFEDSSQTVEHREAKADADKIDLRRMLG